MKSNITDDRPFPVDLVDCLSILNDNDMQKFDSASILSVNDLSNEAIEKLFEKFAPAEYSARRKKKARQLKPILKKFEPSDIDDN